MTAVIATEGLVKDYGPVRALDGLDLEVRAGEVFGFLGPNGSGKSTTIRVLLDLLRPTAGSVRVLGADPREGGPALRARIGYLPGELAVAGRATAGAYLAHLARLRAGRGADLIAPLADRFDLDLGRPIRALSKGNRQKVGVIQAFMHAPELLVLDEPTSGLDPLLQQEFLDLTREAVADGATVFMSSHVLGEVELVADRVAIVRAGAVVDVDDVAALRRNAGQRVEVELAGPVPAAFLAGVSGVEDVTVADGRVTCLVRGAPDGLLRALAAQAVTRLVVRDRTMEDLFLDLYRVSLDGPGEDGGDGAPSRGRRRRGGAA
jgi:ABC-2 type transport system ATP-binding protein